MDSYEGHELLVTPASPRRYQGINHSSLGWVDACWALSGAMGISLALVTSIIAGDQ